MGYSDAQRSTYQFSATNTGLTWALKGPKGKTGRVVDLIASVTTTAAGDTTKPISSIGTTVDTGTENITLNWGATAAKGVIRASDLSSGCAITSTALAADTTFYVNHVAATGASAAGVGVLTAIIDWY